MSMSGTFERATWQPYSHYQWQLSATLTNHRLKVSSRKQQLYEEFQPRILHSLLVLYKIVSYLKLIIKNFKSFVFCCFDSDSVSLSKLFRLISHEPYNNRPVSLTSVMCKVIERIAKGTILEHLSEYNIINGSQHGYTRGRSCLTDLLEFFKETIDEGKLKGVTYTDIG